jgi:small subunit ribosomal protein S2
MDLGASEAPVAVELPAEIELSAATEQFELLSAPRGAPDDLSKLAGVGPQVEKKLNDAGLFHYWQFAAMTDGDAAKIDGDLKLNGRVGGWVKQARDLVAA